MVALFATISYYPSICRLAHGGHRRTMGSYATPPRTNHGLQFHRGDRLFYSRAQPKPKVGYSHFVFAYSCTGIGIGGLVACANCDQRPRRNPTLQRYTRTLANLPTCECRIDSRFTFNGGFPTFGGLPCAPGALGKSFTCFTNICLVVGNRYYRLAH